MENLKKWQLTFTSPDDGFRCIWAKYFTKEEADAQCALLDELTYPKVMPIPKEENRGITREEIIETLRLLLPMAKGYAYSSRVGANETIIARAEKMLEELL